jgi:hypothetical protein
MKRKLNELDQQTKKFRREIQKLRAEKKVRQRDGKKLRQAMTREQELEELLQEKYEEAQQELIEKEVEDGKREKIRCERCNSDKINEIDAGIKIILVCKDCGKRKSRMKEQQ